MEDVARFTYATPRVPNDSLAPLLRQARIEVTATGDCYAPRSLLVATAEGYRCAMNA